MRRWPGSDARRTALCFISVRQYEPFRNNGKRCWSSECSPAIDFNPEDLNGRVATTDPAPARVEFDQSGQSTITPAFARGRSEGSWSDRLQVSSVLFSRPASIQSLSIGSGEYAIQVKDDPRDKFAQGDLLRLNFVHDGFAFVTVHEVSDSGTSPPSSDSLLTLRGTHAAWFEPVLDADVPSADTVVTVGVFTAETSTSPPAECLSESRFETAWRRAATGEPGI
jgi:hypothetical protein